MVLFRRHRQFLDDALKTTVDITSIDHIQKLYPGSEIKIEKYGGIDERCGWDTYIVTQDGKACGFTNGPLNG